MMSNKKVSLVAKLFNNRYGMLDFDSYDLPNTLYVLALATDLPCTEFENTELEYEIYDIFYSLYVDDIINQLDHVTFNWFLRNDNTKITLSFTVEFEKQIYVDIDTKLDRTLEVDRVIKEIEDIK